MKDPRKANLSWEAQCPALRARAKEDLGSDGQHRSEVHDNRSLASNKSQTSVSVGRTLLSDGLVD